MDPLKPCPCCESIQVRVDELSGEALCMDCGLTAERPDLWNRRADLDTKMVRLELALNDCIGMLNTVATCSSHECEDCREWAAKHRDKAKAALAAKVSPESGLGILPHYSQELSEEFNEAPDLSRTDLQNAVCQLYTQGIDANQEINFCNVHHNLLDPPDSWRVVIDAMKRRWHIRETLGDPQEPGKMMRPEQVDLFHKMLGSE